MSEWFAGLKWAEEMYQSDHEDTVMVFFSSTTDAPQEDEFHKGVQDYMGHATRLKSMGLA